MFFDPPQPPSEPERRPRFRREPRMGRPSGELLGGVALELVLVHTDKVAVTLSRLAASRDGLDAELTALTTEEADPSAAFGPWHHATRRGEREDPARALRFGVRYADGSQTEMNAAWGPPGRSEDDLVIRSGGGSGGEGEWRQELWFSPLPPAGTVTFALEWKAQGVELQLHELDAAPIREAAERSRVLFAAEDMPDTPGYSSSTFTIRKGDEGEGIG